MLVTNLYKVSYELIAGFYFYDELRTIGKQKIVYTGTDGYPQKTPEELLNMLKLIEVKA